LSDNTLDLTSPVALYFQLKQALLARIRSDEWVDLKMPSESDLCDEYGVSRVTVRRALSELEHDGYVVKLRGRGTFIALRNIDSELDKVISFTQQVLLEGHLPSTKLLQCTRMPATAGISSSLGLEPRAPVCYLRRLRLIDDVPVLLEDTYLPLSLFPNIDKVDFSRCHLYDVMRDNYGVSPEAWKEYHMASALGDDAGLLRLERGDPALVIEQYTYAGPDLVEYTISTVNSGVYHPRTWVGRPR